LLIDRAWTTEPRWELGRTYDLTNFYFAPSLRSVFFPEHASSTVMRNVEGVDLPIHVRVEDSEGFRSFAAYLYVFAGRPVRHPLVASLRHAMQQIVRGALPLSVIVVEAGSTIEHGPENEALLVEWLGAAWNEFDEVCGSRRPNQASLR
jgi:hypothetical protein